MEQRYIHTDTLKYCCYGLLLVAAYLLQETPPLINLLPMGILLVPAFVTAIAMLEGATVGALYGLGAGFLCAISAPHGFAMEPVLFMICGCGCGLVVTFFLQATYRTALMLSGGFALLYGLISYYFIYGVWGYEGAGRILLQRTLPTAALTALFGMAALLITRKAAAACCKRAARR